MKFPSPRGRRWPRQRPDEGPGTKAHAAIKGLLLLLIIGLLVIACHHDNQLPELFKIPPTQLTTDRGTPIKLSEMQGHVTVYDFIYTRCAGTCPMMTTSLGQVVHRVSDKNVRFVSISVDPKRDTPEVLREYAKRAGNDNRWLFLTGDPKVIADLSEKGFKLAAVTTQANPTEDLLHSSKFALADKSGTIRSYYDGLDHNDIDRLIHDIKELSND